MIKLTNAYLVGIIAATLLVGCGGGDSSNGDDGTGTSTQTTTTPTTTPTTAPTTAPSPAPSPAPVASKKLGADVMPVLEAKCKVCHGSNGRFTITTASSTYNNITALKGTAVAGGQYLLSKGSGTVGHGGGTVIATSSTEYATIKSWVDAGAANN